MKFYIDYSTHSETADISTVNDTVKLAIKLTNYIINNYENKIIKHIINPICTPSEKCEQMFFREEIQKKLQNHRQELQSCLICSLTKYIEEEDTINIDGYVTFRAEKYKEMLEELTEEFLLSCFFNEEYNQFLNRFAKYVEQHSAMCELIIILFDRDKYILADEYGEIFLILQKYDEILLYALLNLLPYKIVIVNPSSFENKELTENLLQIFKKRVIFIEYDVKYTSKSDKE